MYYSLFMTAALCLLYFGVKKYQWMKRIFILLNITAGSLYLLWRFSAVPHSVNAGLVLGILLFISEILGFIQFAFTQYLFSRKYHPPEHPLEEYGDSLPTVDILICTYNEPLKLLERTIIGARRLRYDPSRFSVYVCDDGNRKDLEAMCREYEVGYLARMSKEGAKAGNLNHALSNTDGELFAVLDADMVCTPGFLERTVGYFADEKTAFVQTPQVYYNKDMYQRNLKKDIPNEQDFFMRDIQEGLASINAVLHVGTNAVFRRSYAASAGYYPTSAITEDMAMGMKLQAEGYNGIFVNEMLVYGLSADTYVDLARQRDRWCRGNLQVARNLRPFLTGGLNIPQKLAYFNGFLYWFTSPQKLVYLICPLWFLFTGQRSIDASFAELYQMFLPYFTGLCLAFWSLVPDTRSLKWAHIYDIAMAPHITASIIKEMFRSKKEFLVTPKNRKAGESYFQFRIVVPHMIFLIFTAVAWICGLLNLKAGIVGQGAFAVNAVWSFYNAAGLVTCIRAAYHVSAMGREDPDILEGGKQAWLLYENGKLPCTIVKIGEETLIIKHKQGIQEINKKELALSFQQEGMSCELACSIDVWSGDTAWLRVEGLTSREKELLYGVWVDQLKPHFHVKR